MQVIATARGYDGQAIREIGEEFEWADGYEITDQDWFVAKDAPAAEKAKAVKTKVDPAKTMSESAKASDAPAAE